MNKNHKAVYLPLLATLILGGCVDDKYDLSDIDTTTSIKIKDLILPVNLDPITLGDVIKIEDEDQIKVVEIDGKKVYAVSEKGEFSSSDISINDIISQSPQLEDYLVNLRLTSTSLPAGQSVKMPFPEKIERIMKYKAENLDKSIESVSEVFMNETAFNIYFTTEDILNVKQAVTDVRLRLPKSLSIGSILPAGTYNPETGICTVNEVPIVNGQGKISITIDGIVLDDNDSKIDPVTRDLTMTAHIDIESANYRLSGESGGATLPADVELKIMYGLEDMDITAFSGYVNYALEDVRAETINLSNIPDIFSQDGTDIMLANPQLYISLNNPVADYDLNYQVGLALTAERGTEGAKTFRPDNGAFTVGHYLGNVGPYTFCLSPEEPSSYLEGFSEAEHVEFSTLGKVLSGAGLPETIGVSLPDTRIYSQPVVHFNIGTGVAGLKGNWEFFAPIALLSEGGETSKIVYSKTQSGWSDEDVDAIEIDTLELTANVDSNLPVSATLSGFPIDVEGNQIKGVSFKPVEIMAGAKNQGITLTLTGGSVTHLDGITYTAEISGSNGEALSPDQTLTLKDIKIKVSGNYTKEF